MKLLSQNTKDEIPFHGIHETFPTAIHEESTQVTPRQSQQQETTHTVHSRTGITGRQRSFLTAVSLTIGMIALHVLAQYSGKLLIHTLLPNGATMRSEELAIATQRLDALIALCGIINLALATFLASFVKPHVNRWAIPIANTLFYLAATTEYSLTATPIWILSQSQVTGWSKALLAAAILSILQIVIAQRIARSREQHHRSLE